jgi:hypothetical protein
VKATAYGAAWLIRRGSAGGQIGTDLLSGEHPPGACVAEAFPQIADQLSGNVIIVGNHRYRLAVLCPAHDLRRSAPYCAGLDSRRLSLPRFGSWTCHQPNWPLTRKNSARVNSL